MDNAFKGFSACMSRRGFVAGACALGIAALTGTGCSGAASTEDAVASIRVGTMPTEDILPFWVAIKEGMFEDAGLSAEVITFDSAQSLSAAITAGEVDLAMTDPMRAAKLFESGVELSMDWVTLGTTPEQGRFGVLVAGDAAYASLKDLVGCEQGVGLAANTVPEYVFDKLCEQQGVDPAAIPAQEVASLPDRFSLLSAGQLDAAALPGSMLALGEATGMRVLADDSTGDNISQSVMIVRTEFAEGDGAKALAAAREVWDEAAQAINADPEAYREVLIANANLNDAVAQTYPISTYPNATDGEGGPAHPAASLIAPQLDWMLDKGYLSAALSYDEESGSFKAA